MTSGFVESISGTRRSSRNVGKERPYYGTKIEEVKEVVEVSKKRRICQVKQVSKTTITGAEPNADQHSLDFNGIHVVDLVEKSDDDACLMSDQWKGNNGVSVEAELQINDKCGESGHADSGSNKSIHLRVKETLRAFNTNYLQFVQEEELRAKNVEAQLKISKDPKSKVSENEVDVKRASKRPDLKAISKMKSNGSVLYNEKMIGHLPGISVGDQFFSRAEMVVLGIHSHWLNGIDYMGEKYAKLPQYHSYTFPVATCIVLSGVYEDDLDNSEDVIYTGQGGNDLLGRRHQIQDQKMIRGNLALKNNMACGVPVRVIRGHGSANSYCGKIYTYDGLYKVIKYWAEKGVSGFTVFKYRLSRLEGQPTLTTNQVHYSRTQVPTSISELRGLVCDDISGGQEKFPIPATNVVDDPPLPPSGFLYSKSIQLGKNIKLPSVACGCKCKGECVDPRSCSCARLNGNDFPYVRRNGGRLVEAKAVVFECGPHCHCSTTCVNRTSQHGLRYRLEVYRTPKKGWAVRSWDTIPSGAPVCEYTGILTKTDDNGLDPENNYIFDIDCLQTIKGLDGRERRPGDISSLIDLDDKKSEAPEYCIDAGSIGSVARFINHSCAPNLFVQCILSQHQDIKVAKIMLFAADNIPPLQELSYDYGYVLDSVVGADGALKKLRCFCGSADCRKWLY
ncbi:Histone-lysine N-methyltransferase, H3 lysine-9 specific SUVH4 [Platanthera zijinensis]|uniref:Histone-lysine N-methyltransferase, H3 lysine-9 specific SUVH4 n=1 Tax=Platanthera zijinensis TaxID=2320716 RepID=A0AAP0BI46_9ASPA